MIRNLTLLVSLLTLSINAFSQQDYSFITDRKFVKPNDLVGFLFKPSYKEATMKGYNFTAPERESDYKNVNPGAVTFTLTWSNLMVKGDGIEGTYNIMDIGKTEYGFRAILLDPRRPAERGVWKIVLNGKREADAIAFKKAEKEKEYVFFFAAEPEEMLAKEARFFTDKNEVTLATVDSLWGKSFRPFHRVEMDGGEQKRFSMKDSMAFKFIETVEIVEKGKKKDDSRASTEKTDGSIMASNGLDLAALVNETPRSETRRAKEIRKQFVEIRSFEKDEKGQLKTVVQSLELKSFEWAEDPKAEDADSRFRIALKPKKGDPIFVYLNAKKAVSWIEMGGSNFLARGF